MSDMIELVGKGINSLLQQKKKLEEEKGKVDVQLLRLTEEFDVIKDRMDAAVESKKAATAEKLKAIEERDEAKRKEKLAVQQASAKNQIISSLRTQIAVKESQASSIQNQPGGSSVKARNEVHGYNVNLL